MVQPPFKSPTDLTYDKPRRFDVLARRYGLRIAMTGFVIALLMVLGTVLSSNPVMSSHTLTINQKFGFYIFVGLVGLYVVVWSLMGWGVTGGMNPKLAAVIIAVFTAFIVLTTVIGFCTIHAVAEVIASHA